MGHWELYHWILILFIIWDFRTVLKAMYQRGKLGPSLFKLKLVTLPPNYLILILCFSTLIYIKPNIYTIIIFAVYIILAGLSILSFKIEFREGGIVSRFGCWNWDRIKTFNWEGRERDKFVVEVEILIFNRPITNSYSWKTTEAEKIKLKKLVAEVLAKR